MMPHSHWRRIAAPPWLALAVVCLATPAAATETFVSPTGDDGQPGTESQPWQTIQHAADTVQPGDTVTVRAGTYPEHVLIEITATAADPVVFAAHPDEEVIIEGQNVTLPEWGGLLWVRGASYVTVSGFVVQHAGPHENNAGIFVTQSDHVVVEHNRTYDTVSSGVGVWSSEDVAVRHNEIELACNDGSQECLTIGDTDGFEVAYNEVHHGGPGSNGGEGIDTKDGAANGQVYGNVVHDINRLGIYVDAWDKHTHDIDVFANVVYGCESNGFAVATENGGLLERVRVFNNVAYDNVVGLTVADWGVQGQGHDMIDISIFNNTFANNGDDWGGGIRVISPVVENLTIANNLLSQNAYFQLIVETNPPGLVIDHNLIDGFQGVQHEVTGDNHVEGDPLFVDDAGADFHLLEGSPAIDAALAALAPEADFDGHLRPAGEGFDIGAFEVGSEAPGGGGGTGGSGGTGGTAGTGGTGGTPAAGGDTSDEGGCGCRQAGSPKMGGSATSLLAALALCGLRRRRSGPAPRDSIPGRAQTWPRGEPADTAGSCAKASLSSSLRDSWPPPFRSFVSTTMRCWAYSARPRSLSPVTSSPRPIRPSIRRPSRASSCSTWTTVGRWSRLRPTASGTPSSRSTRSISAPR